MATMQSFAIHLFAVPFVDPIRLFAPPFVDPFVYLLLHSLTHSLFVNHALKQNRAPRSLQGRSRATVAGARAGLQIYCYQQS